MLRRAAADTSCTPSSGSGDRPTTSLPLQQQSALDSLFAEILDATARCCAPIVPVNRPRHLCNRRCRLPIIRTVPARATSYSAATLSLWIHELPALPIDVVVLRTDTCSHFVGRDAHRPVTPPLPNRRLTRFCPLPRSVPTSVLINAGTEGYFYAVAWSLFR